jgi:hypothetical protein
MEPSPRVSVDRRRTVSPRRLPADERFPQGRVGRPERAEEGALIDATGIESYL